LHSSANSRRGPSPSGAQDSTVPVKDEVVAQPEPPGQNAPVSAPPSPHAPPCHGNGRPWHGRHHPRYFQNGHSYAALDLGTNNCRLLVAEPAPYGFRVMDAFSRIVRLGEGLGFANRLSEAAIERTIEALRICKHKMEHRSASRARLVATEACRLAVNGAAFVARVNDELGMELEVVDRRTEAYLAVTGCAALADPRAHAVVIFDIGGGSTEIACLDGKAASPLQDPTKRIRAWDSLPVGVVTLAERHGGVDVTRAAFEAMVEEVTDLLGPFELAVGSAAYLPEFHLLGTSGTVTTVGGIHLRLPRYDRRRVDGMWMNDSDVIKVIDDLLDTPFDQRAANPCIGRDRADLVLAGCAILEAIRRAFPADRLRIADRGLREGILMNLMREDGVWRRGGRG
jgi:exopolyphosphatase/guanosine-5'-triphosphate,3'-diphosphate pyrophosphatase